MNKLFLYFRNGTCFSFTWLVIIALVANLISGNDSLSSVFLLKTLLFCALASLLFSFIFSGVLFRKRLFIFKLSVFTVFFLPIEISYFYWIKLFGSTGDEIKWLIFVGVIVVLYLICLFIDRFIFAKKANEYTFMLNEYKQKRSDSSGMV